MMMCASDEKDGLLLRYLPADSFTVCLRLELREIGSIDDGIALMAHRPSQLLSD